MLSKAFIVSAVAAMLSGATAHVEMAPSTIYEGEYSVWNFRFHPCYEEGKPYQIKKAVAHIPALLKESYAIPGHKAEWPSTEEIQDDGSSKITWGYTGPDSHLTGEHALDLPIMLYIPAAPPGVDMVAIDTTWLCHNPDGDDIMAEQLGEEAPTLSYGGPECPASCMMKMAGGYGEA